jgi:hypothetical protein
LAIDYDDGVGSEDEIVQTVGGDGLRFFTGEALGQIFCALARSGFFGDVGGLHFEMNASVAQ